MSCGKHADTPAPDKPPYRASKDEKRGEKKIHWQDYYIEMLDRDVCARVHVIQ